MCFSHEFNKESAMHQPLSGIRVIDTTEALSGPYCTMLLGDMGAEVIKVERLDGDMQRKTGAKIGDESAYGLYPNRNKRGITVNLKEERGREILLKLVKDADVFTENFRPKVKYRLKIDYETLKEINPRLVYCSISGFGQTGPWADRPGFDQVAQGMSGLMSVTGFPANGPTRVGVAIGDSVCALTAVYGILAALMERERSGTGQHLQTSLLEGLVALLGYQAANYFATGEVPAQAENDHGAYAPYGTYKTKDGYMNITAGTDRMWAILCEQLGVSELVNDAKFATALDRVNHRQELRAIFEERLAQKTTDEWSEILGTAGVACGPIYDLKQVFTSEQVLHQEMLLETEQARGGTMPMIGFPVKMSRTPCRINYAPPYVGQHTDEVLKEFNYSQEEIEELRRDGII